ncbi:DUF2505 domain-containing protein [Kribbella sp. NPDC000426]|uniref:DUF2505 domain-containing protein n=1 Tax=Kribbella sp. NPDC000426 TaxID=3154255 RepID=UPI0033216FE0
MDLQLTTSYGAPPEEVFAIITDVTFQQQVLERLGALAYDVSTLDVGHDLRLGVRWEMPPDDASGVMRRLMGDRLVLEQHKIWHPAGVDRVREADVEGDAAGIPVRLSGHTSIVPTGDGTTQSFDIHVSASVPAIGEKVEQLVTDAVRIRLETKFELVWSWLAGTF